MQHTTFRALSAAALLSVGLTAQTFDREIILRNLEAPTGILAAGPQNDLYFTEIPEPGVMGGRNDVSFKDGMTGAITSIGMGEPEPVNLTMDPSTGAVYWSCKTAGVIIRRINGQNSIFLRGLNQVSGISAPGNGQLYITQLPTPGVPGSQGGTNTVDRVDLATGTITNITTGEPEPYDIVADAQGNAYWTCRTAGVILRYDAASRQTSMLLNDLDQPSGIDMDDAGRLYFSEVPDPGMFGTGNRVWQFDPSNRNFTLISAGEPEPIDVTASDDGSSVYWTCRTAGVIIRSNRIGTQPVVSSPSSFATGTAVRLFLDAGAADAGKMYVAASSLGRGPIDLGTRSWALSMDAIFSATVGVPDSPMALGYMGILDFTGMATAHLGLPADSALQGLDVFSGFAVLDPAGEFGVGSFSSTHRFEVR